MRKLLVFLVVAALPLAASAATITYDLQYVTSYDSGFTSTATMLVPVTGGLGPASGYDSSYYHLFDVKVSISGLAAGEDLKQLGMNLNLAAATDSGFGWQANLSETVTYDSNGPLPGGSVTVPIFASNSDGGTSATDLKSILASINAGPANAAQFGESASGLVGSVYLNWDGSTVGSVAVEGAPPGGSTWVIWTGNSAGNSTTIQTMGVGTEVGETINLLPEPATIGVLALGALGLLRRRR